jgi:hypothetical protein
MDGATVTGASGQDGTDGAYQGLQTQLAGQDSMDGAKRGKQAPSGQDRMDGACSKQAQDKTAMDADEQGPQQSKRAVRLCDSGDDFIPWLQCPTFRMVLMEVRSPVTQRNL